ncbi:hypothetical protein NL676_022788 [Syzygium grande]|nr:hypothetical protein NL676_022788 [Syzygium grande]
MRITFRDGTIPRLESLVSIPVYYLGGTTLPPPIVFQRMHWKVRNGHPNNVLGKGRPRLSSQRSLSIFRTASSPPQSPDTIGGGGDKNNNRGSERKEPDRGARALHAAAARQPKPSSRKKRDEILGFLRSRRHVRRAGQVAGGQPVYTLSAAALRCAAAAAARMLELRGTRVG